ncbi:T9SS type A sorting domain-containing protein [candidate division KSB1 bacterium]|nr:T9SS type A sorting domain-containing protein [candidate division KSB1 bacterium]
MRFVKGFIVVLVILMASSTVKAQLPADFLQLASSSEGVWNNLTYATTGPLLMSGEFNEGTSMFSIDATLFGGFGIDDTVTYTVEGAFVSAGDSVILVVTTPWPGGLAVYPDTVFGSFAVAAYGIVIEITGNYETGSASLEYHMTGGFEAFGTLELTGTSATGVQDEPIVQQPSSFDLAQNFPNPFNPETTISFTTPESDHVNLTVYDILGNEVAVLMNGILPAGYYQVPFNGNDRPSGIYFYRLESGNLKSVKKMILTE